MKKNVGFLGATIVALLTCSAASAQMHVGAASGASMPGRVVPVRSSLKPGSGTEEGNPRSSSAVHATHQTAGFQITPVGQVISAPEMSASLDNFGDENRVPGLGFDYVHLAAVSGNFRYNPPGFERGVRHEHNFTPPFIFGGFPYYSDFLDYQQVQQQPQIIVIQQPAPNIALQQVAPVTQESPANAAAQAPLPEPVREVGEFILVRRDGRIIFASAFSVVGTQLQYVTPEGIRRRLPISELDTSATQDMNEARGTTLQFQN